MPASLAHPAMTNAAVAANASVARRASVVKGAVVSVIE
jgi:hypothetical protein